MLQSFNRLHLRIEKASQMKSALESLLVAVAILLPAFCAAGAPHRLVVQGNDKLAIVAADGSIEWEKRWGPVHDIHVLENGHLLVQQGAAALAEIDPQTKQVVWAYDSKTNGNEGKSIEV